MDVEDACAFGGEHPLVSVSGEEVDAHGLNIDGENAYGLDGIDAEVPPYFVGGVADGFEVDAEAGGILDVGDGNESGSVGDGVTDILDVDSAIRLLGDFGEGDAQALEVLPGVAVGGVFDVGDDDVVA